MMLTEEEWLERLAIEAQQMRKTQPNFKPVNGNLAHWWGQILGTGLYEGVFTIEIIIPREYPFSPPKVYWRTPIWHVNIYKEQVCLSLLGKDWVPASSISEVIEALRVLLTHPNPNDPLNREAANEFRNDYPRFERKVREYLNKYATWEYNRTLKPRKTSIFARHSN